MLGTVHVVCALAALILGTVVFFRPKGGRQHRLWGYCYGGALLLVNIGALSVYKQSAGVGPFHVLALVSLVTLISGFIPVLLRRPVSGWLALHAYFISWSYVGLVAAGVAQLVTLSTSAPAWLAVGLPSVLLVAVGGGLIHTRVPQTLRALRSGR